MDLSSVLMWASGAGHPGAVAASPVAALTLTQVVITAVAAVIVFVAVLVGAGEISRRRARRGGEEEYEGAPGYGRPDGYGPPPLWTDSPSDQRSGWP
jgi:hypothetical protein